MKRQLKEGGSGRRSEKDAMQSPSKLNSPALTGVARSSSIDAIAARGPGFERRAEDFEDAGEVRTAQLIRTTS